LAAAPIIAEKEGGTRNSGGVSVTAGSLYHLLAGKGGHLERDEPVWRSMHSAIIETRKQR
jgi:hypothetical protein